MKIPLLTLILPLAVLLTSCQTGGSKNRYEYPPAKLSSAKQVKGASLDGRFVILDDGSMWNIDWTDAKKAKRWGAGDKVNIIAVHGRSSFPYSLMKQSSGERVAARYGKKL